MKSIPRKPLRPLATAVRRTLADSPRLIALTLATTISTSSALADGGRGGFPNGGVGGTDSAESAGGNGSPSTDLSNGGGGGGGAGVTGGTGGQGGSNLGVGGAGGQAPGESGQDGAGAGGQGRIGVGGGGGGGGAHGYVAGALPVTSTTGGDGGNGGNGISSVDTGLDGGGGGAGGYGAVITGSGASGTISVDLTGGNGGNGGDGSSSTWGGSGGSGGIGLLFTGGGLSVTLEGNANGGDGGNTGIFGGYSFAFPGGGDGGIGVSFSAGTFTNQGNIAGGDGGGADLTTGGKGGHGVAIGGGILANHGSITGGNGGSSNNGIPGAGGSGVFATGPSVTVINSGTITGGFGGDGAPANAITFSSGNNRLELRPGSTIDGIVAGTGSDTLALGGADEDTFVVSAIGNQYLGFVNFEKTGASTWTLDGATTQVTPWRLLAGTLAVSSDASLGDTFGQLILDGGTLRSTAAFTMQRNILMEAGGGTVEAQADLTASGIIEGGGSLTKTGSGALILTGDSVTYTSDINIVEGVLQLGNGGLTGLVEGNIDLAAGATLVLNRDDNTDVPFQLDQAISGAGGLRDVGPGTTILSGVKSYTGPTTVENGTLVAESLASASVEVHSGAILQGYSPGSTLSGEVTVQGGATLRPEGLMNLGALVLESGSLLDYELGLPTSAPGSEGNDRINISGDLTIGGATLNIADLGGFAQGTYRIFDYGGTLTGGPADLLLGTIPDGFDPADFTVQTAVANQVNLVVSAGGLFNQWWDGTNTVANGVIDGGDGTWVLDQSNWTNADGSANSAWEPGFAIFAGATGTVTLGQDIPNVGGMQFVSDGYLIEGNGFVLQMNSETQIRVAAGNADDTSLVATIAAPLVDGDEGAATLIKTGAGTLVLEGSNSYSGGTQILGGTVQVAADANLGDVSGALFLSDGVLHTTASFSSARGVTLEPRGVVRTDADTTLTLSGAISGAGELIKEGNGTLEVTNNSNSYSGGTRVAAGTLHISADGALGGPSGALILGGMEQTQELARALGFSVGNAGAAGGTLQLGASFELAQSRSIRIDDPGGTFDTNGFDLGIHQEIGGAGHLTKAGEGTLLLTADSSYTGGTTIASGVLQLGDGGTSGIVLGDIVNDGTLVFDRSDDLIYHDQVSGSGEVIKEGGNTLVFTADHTYEGDTTIAGGTLQLGAGGTSGSVTGDIVNRGALVFNRSDDISFNGAIISSGSGSVTQAGTGVVTLGGANTYTDGTFFNSGILAVAADQNLGDASGPLGFDGGTLRFDAAFDLASSRAITLGAGGGTIDTQSFTTTASQAIGGEGGLTKSGNGALVLTGDSDYQGGTTIEAGTLQLGNGGESGSIVGGIFNNGSLVFFRSDDITQADEITGDGELVKLGDNTLTITGVHSYTGNTQLREGQLLIEGELVSQVNVSPGATLLGGNGRVAAIDNAGLLTFLPPQGGQFKTITTRDYIGSGGTVTFNTMLGADNSPTDRLIIDGGDGVGNSPMVIVNAGGAGDLTRGNGILVVEDTTGQSTDPNLFTLVGPVTAGPYEYTLHRSSLDDSGPESWYLRSHLDCRIDPEAEICLEPIPNYREEVSRYAAILPTATIYGRTLLDTLHERVGDQEQLRGRRQLGLSDTFNGAWGRAISHRGKRDGHPLGIHGGEPANDYRLWALQLGLDVYRAEDNLGGRDHAGFYGAFGQGRTDVEHNFVTGTKDAGKDEFDAWSLGAYWTHFNDNGAYIDGVLQATYYDMDTRSGRPGLKLDTDGWGGALSVEGGYPFHLGDAAVADSGWLLEPQVQLIIQRLSIGSFNDGAARVRFKNADATAGRLGLRAAYAWQNAAQRKSSVWVRPSVWRQFEGEPRTEFSSNIGYIPFPVDMRETWGQLAVGASVEVSDKGTVYGDVTYQETINSGDGDSHAWEAKLGFRLNW